MASGTNTGKYAEIDEDGCLVAVHAGMISISYKINGVVSKTSFDVEIYDTLSTPDAPEVEEVTDTTITVKAVDGCEYSLDGFDWQDENTFTDLEPDTEYTVYARRAYSGFMFASDESEATIVRTKEVGDEVWPFKDVDPNSAIAKEVLYAYKHGISSGFGKPDENGQVNFKPEKAVTRAQFAIMIYGMAGKPGIDDVDTSKYQYSDVPTSAGCYEAVVWASSRGIISGYSNGKFKPDSNITRSQIAMMLKRFADYMDLEYLYETGGQDLKTFADYGDVKKESAESLQWAIDNGILSGITKTKLKPNGNARRDQCAAFCARFYKAFIE